MKKGVFLFFQWRTLPGAIFNLPFLYTFEKKRIFVRIIVVFLYIVC